MNFKKKAIAMLVQLLLSVLSPERLKDFADTALDFIKEKVLGTASTIDDRIVLPICDMIREAFVIPDDNVKEKMEVKKNLIGMLIPLLLSSLTPPLIKDFADTALDFIEEKVLGTASKIDDALVLPVCNMIRNAFEIPDDDEEEPEIKE